MSSAAVQSYSGEYSWQQILRINEAMGNWAPDLVILLDIPVDLALYRIKRRGEGSRALECEAMLRHMTTVYRWMRVGCPDIVKTVDATGPVEAVHEKVMEVIHEAIG